MKRALTLIELIFTMVIIAFTFSVIPRVIYLSNKSLEFSNKEDAIFNMMAKMMDLSVKEYDEKNLNSDDILLTGNDNTLECKSDYNFLRVGGFSGSRNCKNQIIESDIPSGTHSNEFSYIEGYNDYEKDLEYPSKNSHKKYTLSIKVGYTDEWGNSNYVNNNLSFQFTNRSDNSRTNIKRIYIQISDKNKKISSIKYYSSNIGHQKIESVVW